MLSQQLAGQSPAIPQPIPEEPQDFRTSVKELYSKAKSRSPDAAKAVLTVETMANVIRLSKATTLMELDRDLREASQIIQAEDQSISVKAACELFLCFVTRTQLDLAELDSVKERLLERGDQFAQVSNQARQAIAANAAQFIHDGQVILTHGYSRCVREVLIAAVKARKRFKLIATLGRPILDPRRERGDGYRLAAELDKMGVEVLVIETEAAAAVMDEVTMVLVGAEGVFENGAIINKVGTRLVAAAAHDYQKPVYVAVESYKFARMFPLSLNDPVLRPFLKSISTGETATLSRRASDRMRLLDLTKPQLITALCTDLGVLTTESVSHELTQLYR